MTPTEITEAIKAIVSAIHVNETKPEWFPPAENSMKTIEALNKIIIALVNEYKVCDLV